MSAVAQRYVPEPDGMGGTRHVLRLVSDIPQPKQPGRKKRHVPDPIQASAESAAQQLKQFIERIEGIDADIAEQQADKADVFNEARSMGFDKKTMSKIMALRKMEKHALDEAEALFETYRAALGLA